MQIQALLVTHLIPVKQDITRPLHWLLLMVAGSLLIALSARMQIPFWPVPMTMQTFAVLVIGMACGWRLGGATLLLYLLEGAAGLPVFASGVGLAYMAGPTGGYLLGFLVAAVCVGWLAEKGWDRSVLKTLLAMTLGTLIIFFCGVAWLGTLIGFEKALNAGFLPFIPGAITKILLATALLPSLWHVLQRRI